MEKLVRNSIHVSNKSHDYSIYEINGKKVNMTYESYNAVERFTVEIFDGYKWNYTLSMLDLGVKSENGSYIWNEDKRIKRCEDLIKKGLEVLKKLL